MKEYTLIALCSVAAAILLDQASQTHLLRKGRYWLFLAIILFFKFLVNGYLTGQYIVVYNPQFFFGIRLGSIPAEDFLFGFSMVTMSVIFWEYFKFGRGRCIKE